MQTSFRVHNTTTPIDPLVLEQIPLPSRLG